jgi:long-chain acyl-CoA synthetase
MGSEVANEAGLPRGTLVELFLTAVDRFGDHPAFRHFPGPGPELRSISYGEAYESVRAVAHALDRLGLARGDRAAILAENRPEWALTDYGCLCAGVMAVPIYATLTAQQVAYILADSGAKAIFASTREQMEKALDACGQAGGDVKVVVYDEVPDAPAEVLRWSALLAEGRDRAASSDAESFRARARTAGPDDVATILYTSGTTGQPKGVMLTHDNLHSNVLATTRVIEVTEADSTLSFLPLSHVLQRMGDYLFFSCGCTIAYAHDLSTVADDLRAVKPTIVVSVPRVYERVYNKVMDKSGVSGRLVRWAREVGMAWAEEKLAGREPSGGLKVAHALADRLVFRKIRKAIGGRLRFFVSGGAPLEPAIARFFYGAGILILEGYGLTETSPVTNINTPDRIKIGTVGPAVPGTEVRIAEDGEILVRGPQVMKGYYNLPQETAKVLSEDGWFQTGDIGEIDADGFLRITDRKKDLIVTAGGKNVAPQPIENRLKTNAYVEQVVMVGDRRKFVALLVVPAAGPLEAWAREKGLRFSDRSELLALPEVHALLERELLPGLDDLASYERPKKIALLEEEFTIDNGTLTPTQKVKRRVVQERFKHVIDAFYEDANVDRTVFAASEFLAAGVPESAR